MRIQDLDEGVGRIIKGVNTTVDVGPNEIKTQAAKFGNVVDRDGFPPSMNTHTKGKSTTVIYNKNVKEERYTAYEWALIEGGHALDKPTPSIPEIAKKHNVKPGFILKQLKKGIEVEYEHTSDFDVAREIALDHLAEFPDYYDRLEKVEKPVPEFKQGGNIWNALTEGIMVKFERGPDYDILHFKDTNEKSRVEVRGKKGYESGGYDPKDPLHQTLDKLGKAASISDLMNGDTVHINPHHPDGKRALATAKNVMSEDVPEVQITPVLLQKFEVYLDRMFAALGIDIEFTRHFIDRLGDPRNGKPITMNELARLFKLTYSKYGKAIAKMGPDAQAVIKDMQTDINMPFVLNWDPRNKELDLVTKTIMRKKNFTTPNKELRL